MGHRYTVDIPDDLWQDLISRIGKGRVREFILEAIRRELERKSMKAVVLCGGEGTRLRPLTVAVPKPMLPVGYRPILEHRIAHLKKHGIKHIILSVGYLREVIMKYFEDGSRFGVQIYYVTEDRPLDTGGAIRNAKPLIGEETFFAMNGDIITDADLTEMLRFHRRNGGIATILLVPVENVSRFGVVEMDDSRIKRFVEKPKPEEAPSNLINGGLYIFEPEVFDYIKSDRCSLERDVFPKLAEDGQLYGFVDKNCYWIDIGIPQDYERAWRDFLEGRANLMLEVFR